MPPRAKDSRTDLVFGALANRTRRDILDMLLGGGRTVVALAEHFDMARPSVSEHLKVLRDCGLVTEDKHGRFRHYRVNPAPLQEISAWLDPHERYWRQRLSALGEVLDELRDEEEKSSWPKSISTPGSSRSISSTPIRPSGCGRR